MKHTLTDSDILRLAYITALNTWVNAKLAADAAPGDKAAQEKAETARRELAEIADRMKH